jgi:hypothetical protein
MELGDRGEGKENDRASVISHNIRCEGCVVKDVKNGGWEEKG